METDEERLSFVKADELPAFRCLPLLNFIGMCVLSLAMILLWSTSLERGHAVGGGDGLILKNGAAQEQHSFEVGGSFPFNIYELPADGTPHGKRGHMTGFLMRLPVRGYLPLDFERLAHYSVCCHTADRAYFVCHSVTQNIGVDCVIQKEKSSNKPYASIVVQHSDMVGAMCVLYWNYKIKQ